MPTITAVRNGAVKANPKRRRKARRNPVTAKAANPRRRRRRNPVASVTTRAANPSKAANPRRRRRRNGVTVAKANPRRKSTRRRRNGIFGDTKAEAKQVLSLLAGLAGTKLIGGIATPYVAQLLAYVGMAKFAQPVSNAAVAIFAVAPVAGMVGGRDSAKLARLGGLAVAGLDVLQLVLPSGFSYSPFASNTAPIVLAGGISPDTAKQIASAAVAEVAAGNNAANTTSKVGMIFDHLGARNSPWSVGNSPQGVPLM